MVPFPNAARPFQRAEKPFKKICSAHTSTSYLQGKLARSCSSLFWSHKRASLKFPGEGVASACSFHTKQESVTSPEVNSRTLPLLLGHLQKVLKAIETCILSSLERGADSHSGHTRLVRRKELKTAWWFRSGGEGQRIRGSRSLWTIQEAQGQSVVNEIMSPKPPKPKQQQ